MLPITKKEFQTILTTRLLLERNGHVLFLEQTGLNGGEFTLPGGKIESEEFAKKALVRETYEEIGIQIKSKNLRFLHITHRKTKNSSEMILFFHATAKYTQEPIVKEPEKFQNVVWVPLGKLPDELTDVLKNALIAMHKGESFSQFPKTEKIIKDNVIEAVNSELEMA